MITLLKKDLLVIKSHNDKLKKERKLNVEIFRGLRAQGLAGNYQDYIYNRRSNATIPRLYL
jgi:hypothetical protein